MENFEGGRLSVNYFAGSPMIVAGPTKSGKTTFVRKLLEKNRFSEKIHSVLYCYGVDQPDVFKEFEILNLEVRFHQGIPTMDTLKKFQDGNFRVVVLDDLMQQVLKKGQEVQDMFTQLCHHCNMTAIFITQNVLGQGKHARNIALNVHYLVLFAQRRDASQIRYLGKQAFPQDSAYFWQSYEHATSKPFGHLTMDFHPYSPKKLCLRSDTLSDDGCVVYLNKKHLSIVS